MTTLSKIEQVRQLRKEAGNLRGATQRWREKYRDRQHYDKQGFGFTLFTDRSCAFSVPKMSFEAYVGTYGCSSVSTAWRVDQKLVDRLFMKALNGLKQEIFDSMAAMAEAEAAAMIDEARAELTEIQKLLEVTEPPKAVDAA